MGAFFLFVKDIYIKNDYNMAKAIINKHIDSVNELQSSVFHQDIEKAKGEIVICNDPNNPTIYILDTEGSMKKIAGGGGSGSGDYDDTELRGSINELDERIDNLEENGVGSSTLQEPITVAGLDEKFGSGYYSNGDVIPVGTDISVILQNILCNELYPTSVSGKSASATVKMNDLSLILDNSGDVEVGTLVTLIEAKTNGVSVSSTPSSINNMIYGYSLENDNVRDSADSSISTVCTTTLLDNSYEISASIISGFDADNETLTKTIPETKSGDGSCSLDETILGCISEGENKIEINAVGASYSYSADAIDKVYYCSNLGKTDMLKYHNGIQSVNGETEKATSSKSQTINGLYKYFVGYSSNTSYEQFDSESVRSLDLKSDWIVKDGETIIVKSGEIVKSNGESIVIACPSKYKLASINYSNNADMLSNFTSIGKVSVSTGSIMTDYNVYIYPITNGSIVEFTNLSLTNA